MRGTIQFWIRVWIRIRRKHRIRGRSRIRIRRQWNSKRSFQGAAGHKYWVSVVHVGGAVHWLRKRTVGLRLGNLQG
jgi:hypothetical protein